MRILILDANYPAFLEEVYRVHPGLAHEPYERQRAVIRTGLFGEVGFQVDALRALGHVADSIITNAIHAQRAWCQEHGIGPPRVDAWRLSRRRGMPLPSRMLVEVDWAVVLEQVRRFRPDVIYVGILETLDPTIVRALKPMTRLVVAQIAAAVPAWDYSGYDLIMSSIPALVERFQRMGIRAVGIPLAFEPSVLRELGAAPARDIPVSFVGSFSDNHPDRLAILEAVARVAPLATWTPSGDMIPEGSPVKPTIRGAAFGRQMYSILGRSRVTLNSHHQVAGHDANNLRLFEATGVGALLITEDRRNLGELFEIGSEVVVYRDPDEAAELTLQFLSKPDEASKIAAAGQARTLGDHTWTKRMERVCDILHDGLRATA